MAKMIIELAAVLLSVILAVVLSKKDPTKAKKTAAISFVLTFAVVIAFTLAQFSTQMKLLNIALLYTPLDMLSLLAVIYCISAATAKGNLFDKLIGE